MSKHLATVGKANSPLKEEPGSGRGSQSTTSIRAVRGKTGDKNESLERQGQNELLEGEVNDMWQQYMHTRGVKRGMRRSA